jgi:hypothetical protein
MDNAIMIGMAQNALLRIADMFDPDSCSKLRARIGNRKAGAPVDQRAQSEKQLRDANIRVAVLEGLLRNLEKAALSGLDVGQRTAERRQEVIEEVAKRFEVSKGVVEAAARVPRKPTSGQTSGKERSRKS